VFNLEGSERVTIRSLVDAVAEAVGCEVDVTYTEARAADYEGAPISAAKAGEILGWAPSTAFRDGLQRYVEWHLETAAAPAPVAVRTLAPPVVSIPAGVGLAAAASLPVFAGADLHRLHLAGIVAAIAGLAA